jgi:hypothetical protein
VRPFLTLVGISLIIAGFGYLLFPHAAVGLTGIELPAAAAAVDARATYGGTQIGIGLFLLWCRANATAERAGLVLVLLFGACLVLARVFGFAIEGEFDWFNAAGAAAELVLTALAGILLQRDRSEVAASGAK